jgi:hypothetical protein
LTSLPAKCEIAVAPILVRERQVGVSQSS